MSKLAAFCERKLKPVVYCFELLTLDLFLPKENDGETLCVLAKCPVGYLRVKMADRLVFFTPQLYFIYSLMHCPPATASFDALRSKCNWQFAKLSFLLPRGTKTTSGSG